MHINPAFTISTVPTVAGAVLATCTYWKIPQIIYRLLKKWRRNSWKISIRVRKKRQLMLSSLKQAFQIHQNYMTPPETIPQNEVEADSMSQSLKEVMDLCVVNHGVSFLAALPLCKQMSAVKIAEGTYAEIYKLTHVDGSHRIFKCMPVNGQHPDSGNINLPIEMAIPDIICSSFLSELNEGPVYLAPNFPKVYKISLIKDEFPAAMMRCWWDYKNSPKRLEDPAEHFQPNLYPEDQLYLATELDYCGEPATLKNMRNAWSGLSIITQVASALAIAEVAFNFEHRDLHLGNLLLNETNCPEMRYVLESFNFSVQTVGQQVFVIDFTLSRINVGGVHYMSLDHCVCDNDEETECDNLWLDHRTVYKVMAEYSSGQWSNYMPVTNVLWLKYILEHVLHSLFRNNPSFRQIATNRSDENQMRAVRLLRGWNDTILEFNSARSLLFNLILKNNPLVTIMQS
ncbi:serine/threonine-protein kinase haspin-like [Uloborus diversus]|uniref:serine/threonine-protein kinase haspin-like n=1 Tax=Uloborus diversus TaxID=327109 RepID=UPI00240A51ED|nr:serine/threonine-protein kinase haspin-like [Uloborus diversus]